MHSPALRHPASRPLQRASMAAGVGCRLQRSASLVAASIAQVRLDILQRDAPTKHLQDAGCDCKAAASDVAGTTLPAGDEVAS